MAAYVHHFENRCAVSGSRCQKTRAQSVPAESAAFSPACLGAPLSAAKPHWAESGRSQSQPSADSDPWAHLALGYAAYNRRRTDEAVDEFHRAFNPSFAAAHGYLGLALALDGRSDQAIDHIEQAIRMSPHDPQNAIFNVGLASAHYLAGRYNEAIGCSRKALQQRSGLTNAHRIYIASLAQAGQIDEARAAHRRYEGVTAPYFLAPEPTPRRRVSNVPETNNRFGPSGATPHTGAR
jgi:tetratricopeptide (TPR) repeat protein